MKEMIDNKVVNDVTTKKKYVKPEIEAIDLDAQPMLLAQSAGFMGIDRDIDE
jgi:hypothetical protein